MNKYAELNKIATLYVACRGILRVKLAAAAAAAPPKTAPATPPASTGTTTAPASTTTTTPGTGGTPYPEGTTGGVVPPKQPQKQSWGEWLQDMLDWGNDQVQNNGSLVTKEQQAAADSYNAQQHQKAMEGLANGEWNDWDPSQQARASTIQTEDAVKKENADGNNSNGNGNGGNGQNITINNNMPEGYGGGGGGGYGYASEGGGGQQFQSSPSFADYINQYSQYRRQTS